MYHPLKVLLRARIQHAPEIDGALCLQEANKLQAHTEEIEQRKRRLQEELAHFDPNSKDAHPYHESAPHSGTVLHQGQRHTDAGPSSVDTQLFDQSAQSAMRVPADRLGSSATGEPPQHSSNAAQQLPPAQDSMAAQAGRLKGHALRSARPHISKVAAASSAAAPARGAQHDVSAASKGSARQQAQQKVLLHKGMDALLPKSNARPRSHRVQMKDEDLGAAHTNRVGTSPVQSYLSNMIVCCVRITSVLSHAYRLTSWSLCHVCVQDQMLMCAATQWRAPSNVKAKCCGNCRGTAISGTPAPAPRQTAFYTASCSIKTPAAWARRR
jgi:hypothetical protein